MKKSFMVLIAVVVVLLLVGCDPEKYHCGCPYCDPNVGECVTWCQYKVTGECFCPNCNKPTIVEPEDNIEVVTREQKSIEPQTRLNIVIKRPEVLGLSDYNFQQTLNKEIKDAIEPYYNEISNLKEGFTTQGTEDDLIQTKSYKYDVTYDWYRLGDFLSVVVKNSIRTGNPVSLNSEKTDGLRSSDWSDTYVINVKTNKKVKLSDVCSFSDWNSAITDEINKQSQEEGIDLVLGNGLEKISDNQKFYIDDESQKIVVCFEPGSIAKYSAGELLFEMPFTFDKTTQKFKK